MGIPASPSRPGLSRPRALALLAGIGAVAFTVPGLGFVASLMLPFLAQHLRPTLWPRTPRLATWVWSFLAVIGLWWIDLVIFLPMDLPFNANSFWLIVPLCAPENATTWLVPALAATVVYTLGAAVTAWLHRAWPWVLGAWTASVAYEVVGGLMPTKFFC